MKEKIVINNLIIKNFKYFETLNLEMSTLNVFTGINSMGKSSIIQALLLLRQSYEMGSIIKGLHLNGELTKIGTGYDLMNRNSNEDEIEIGIVENGKNFFWKYIYDNESDYQNQKETNINIEEIKQLNIFKSTFSYISGERIGPQRFYTKSYHEI